MFVYITVTSTDWGLAFIIRTTFRSLVAYPNCTVGGLERKYKLFHALATAFPSLDLLATLQLKQMLTHTTYRIGECDKIEKEPQSGSYEPCPHLFAFLRFS